MRANPRYSIAVVGGSDASEKERQTAEEVGRRLAEAQATVVCGGLGGVMEAACRGAKSAGGRTVGILPGKNRADANPWVDVAVPTGLGEARNVVVVRAADAVIAVGGEYGTLSEIAFALRAGKPVAGVGTWDIPGVVATKDAAAAVGAVLELLDLTALGPGEGSA